MTAGRVCAKCGHVRSVGEACPDSECPECGVIYDKAEDLARKNSLADQAQADAVEKGLRKCPGCRKFFDKKDTVCPHCKKAITPFFDWVIAGIVIAVVLSLLFTDGWQCSMSNETVDSVVEHPTDAPVITEKRRFVGKWYSSRSYAEANIELFYAGGSLYIETYYFVDGSGGVSQVVERDTPKGRKIQTPGEVSEYFVINADGNLEFWSDRSGNYYTATKR